ncbi:MAG: ubiquinone/menaquinone biosynthesis methyltransferase [Chloroflexota bacterium]
MANLNGLERAQYVQAMFARIAFRYDLMNRLITAGQDVQWRKEVIRRAALPPEGKLLDLGAGTGDLARQAQRQHPGCLVVAADFTLEMMRVGQARHPTDPSSMPALHWSAADAHCLPFPEATFDAVVSGFLLRNVSDVTGSLAEQYRVLKPGGNIVCLDTTPPSLTLAAPLVNFHLHTVIPTLGRMLTGQQDAYRYLPESTEGFLEPEQLAARLAAVGFQQVRFHRLMLGNIAIHWGHKPDEAKQPVWIRVQ